ncbi:MAG TPA: bifunctional YncE family protein/alkaline phosphatase family protein [Caulobacteraceae bacterium]|jgi:DNA-binding beta-propeller fold protein YncE
MAGSMAALGWALAASLMAAPAFAAPPPVGQPVPNGELITPLAAPGAVFQPLNPDLARMPDFTVGQAARLALSPDGRTQLILTSGFNRNLGPDGKNIPELSNEYVFVYDVSGEAPRKTQVLQVADTYLGIAWARAGDRFFVSGGVDDDAIEFAARPGGGFAAGRTFKLGHKFGIGLKVAPQAAGVAVSPNGRWLLVANFQNDSVSLVDLASGKLAAEQDLRPGKLDPRAAGQPGGTYPQAVVWVSDAKAYVGTLRDREVIALGIQDGKISVGPRIATPGQPDAFLLAAHGRRLYVAEDNTDRLLAIDPASDRIVEAIRTTAPAPLAAKAARLGGAGTNSISLSPDGRTAYVANAGENAVAVIRLSPAARGVRGPAAPSRVLGLIPTGWYPTDVAASADGARLYVINGKSDPGPNPKSCTVQLAKGGTVNQAEVCDTSGQYVWQLEKAGFLTLPTPGAAALAGLTHQVAVNNHMVAQPGAAEDAATFAFLRRHIHHVIYVLKENRTYDQVLGDLEEGNGDPKLAILGGALSPNHHALARQFVDLDNFFAAGESSNTGWTWSTAARTTDFTEREAPVNYAGRGLQFDQMGYNRNVDVAVAGVAARKQLDAIEPSDPDVLAGARDVAAPDGPDGEEGAGYIWDSALRAGLTVRNYGFFGVPPRATLRPVLREPWKEGRRVIAPSKPSLVDKTDLYYPGLDLAYDDYWRFVEWKREFDAYLAKGDVPSLMLVDLPQDHFGQFKEAIDGVDTVETQMGDNDYSLGRLVQAVAESPIAKDTLIFVVEDDAQDGPDHVNAHRTVSFVIGPYVKQHAVVSTRYTTVSLLRTMELALGISPLGLIDAFTPPMTAVFDTSRSPDWSYHALMPPALRTTQLPLPPATAADASMGCLKPLRSSGYWAKAMANQDFTEVDHLEPVSFNLALWRGLKGDGVAYPKRSGRDLREDRAARLAAAGVCGAAP